MTLNDFKELGLNLGIVIKVTDENGCIHKGRYLGDFDPANMTFSFMNYGEGEQTIHIDKAQRISRLD